MIRDDNTHNKLLLLFILEKLEMPIAEDLLLEICSIDNVWIPYILGKQVLFELSKSGLVISTTLAPNKAPLISLSNDGRICLSHFFNEIPLSKQDEIKNYIKDQRIKLRKRQEFLSDFFLNKDGTYTVNLKIVEIAEPLIEIKINVDNRAIATSVANSWVEKASDVYRMLHEQLIES